MQGINDKSQNKFISKSEIFNSKSMEKFDPTAIKNRLPNVIFSGPNGIYHQRVTKFDYPHELGIGKASTLRSLDADYIFRGTSNAFIQKRRDYVGEIGWSARYFGRFSPSLSAIRLPDINYVPR